MFQQFRTTEFKISVARQLYKVVSLFYGKEKKIIQRGGINFEVDLSEGIDLSLFLFGNFQKHIFNQINLKKDAVVFDIGANFGVMSLKFSQLATQGKIYSFEPTHYAIERLKRNLELNPALAKNIKIVNSFVSENSSENPEIKAFSSWKVDGKSSGDEHPVHFGTSKSADGTPSISLNDFCEKNEINRLDFIKIDTDGHEFEVFKGAKEALKKLKPIIVFEIGQYVMAEKNITFDFYHNYFKELNYKLIDLMSGKEVTLNNFKSYIPEKGTTDLLAIPN